MGQTNNDEQNIAMKSSLISSMRIGLSAELKISKTSIELLSIPYMTYCEHFGCRHDFYKLSFDNDIFDYYNNSVIEIKNNRKKHLIYHAEPKLELVDFISNIGGLFGLYFGLSFIDISDILKSITRRIKFHLKRLLLYRKIKVIIDYLKLSTVKILQYIKLMTKIPWKLILTFLSSPFFISQMLDLIINYFQFSIQISFEFVEYQQKNQKILINEFPAITLCTEHMFEKVFFDKYYIYHNPYFEGNPSYWLTNLFANQSIGNRHNRERDCRSAKDHYYLNKLETCNINILTFLAQVKYKNYKFKLENEIEFKILSKYFDINTEEEYQQSIKRIEDKSINGLNGTLDLLDFYVNDHNCRTLFEPNIKCEDLKPIIKTLSPFGKCHTYLMGNNNNKIFIDKIELLTGEKQGELRTYLRRKFILHSSDHLPIWTSNHFRATDLSFGQFNSFIVRIRKIQMNKLSAPYDQKCHDYSGSQQFECMNKCIEKYYNQKFKCFPNNNNYYTIMVDSQILKEKFIFCNESEFISKTNNFFVLTCQSECGEPCSIINYDEDLVPLTKTVLNIRREQKYIQFIVENVDYLKIIWLPQLTIISLFIKIFNICSLWNGINFKQIIDLIFKYIKQVYSFIYRKININYNWTIYFNYEIIKV